MKSTIITSFLIFVSLFFSFTEKLIHSWDSTKSWTKASTTKIILSRSYFNGEIIETYISESKTYISFSSITSPVDITGKGFNQVTSFVN